MNLSLHRTVAGKFPGHRVGIMCRECHLFVSVPVDVMGVFQVGECQSFSVFVKNEIVLTLTFLSTSGLLGRVI